MSKYLKCNNPKMPLLTDLKGIRKPFKKNVSYKDNMVYTIDLKGSRKK